MNPFTQLVEILSSPSFLLMFLMAWGVMYAVYKYYVKGHPGSYAETPYFAHALQQVGYQLVGAQPLPNTDAAAATTALWQINATDAQGKPAQLTAQVSYTNGNVSGIVWTPDLK